MKVVSGREFARIVERRGWRLLRVAGSHHIYGKTGSVVRLSIPIHGHRPLKTGLLHHLIKLAELSDSDLEQSINRVPHPLVLAARTSSSPLRGAGYKRTSILILATRFFAPEFLASHCTKALASKK